MAALDTLVPRRYQEEIFTQAQQENVIAALGTGSGKTYISSLLIKWIATRDVSQGKVVIFLVPKVALVEQQGKFIEKTTSLRVIKLHGQSPNIDLDDRSRWSQRFQNSDVFVLTAQLFLNILTHSIWSIDKVSLIVLDECHHARKNHPYNSIMREYDRIRADIRPRVFGMTASPIWIPKDARTSLKTLENNLHAKVIGVRENTDELAQHSPKPQEVIEQYPPSPPTPEEYDFPSPSLWQALSFFNPAATLSMDIVWSDIERRYHVTMQNLGPYCASLYLYMEMKHAIKQSESQNLPLTEMESDLIIISSLHESRQLPTEFYELIDVVGDFESFFTPLEDPLAIPPEIPLEWCSPKLRSLVNILLAHQSPKFQCIIFVEQRQVAACLASVLSSISGLRDFLKCGYFVRQSSGDDRASQMMHLVKSTDSLDHFRQGFINVLVATSVAEEGLDFPACDLVIRFDPLQHLVGYIQSRGRAREKVSKYVVMVQQNDKIYLDKYRAFSNIEPELQELYQASNQMAADAFAEGKTEELEDEEVDPGDLENRERYVVPSTNAFVNYDNAIALLDYLCALLPRDLYTALPAPVFNGDFQSTLRLPASLPLSAQDLVYTGPLKSTKKEAKRAVAFLAVKRLHQLDVFDDYLFPVNRKNDGTVDADGQELRNVSDVPPMMDVWTRYPWVVGEKLWVHPIHADGSLLAGIVTGTLLPPVKMNIGGVSLKTLRGHPLEVAGGEDEESSYRKIMSKYTKRGLWYCVTAVELTGPPNVFLVPLTPSHSPDFTAMQRLLSNPFGNSDWADIDESHHGRILVRNTNQHGRTLLLQKIRNDMTPMTVMPESPEGETYHAYLTKRWTRKKLTRKKWDPLIPTDGPMIEVTRLERSQTSAYSLGTDSGRPAGEQNGKSDSSDLWIIPLKCCGWIDMTEDMIRAFGFFPPLLHRLWDIYRVRQAKFELGLPAIQDDLLVQAFTIPGVAASYNNQRLETLGDAVLEICTTVHLLNKFPHRHEGQLSVLRKNSICNSFLLSRALDIGLDRFVISEKQSVRIWPYVVSDEVEESSPSTRLAKCRYPRRSLQDCMEATIGAAFVTGGIPMALHTGVALGMTFGGSLPWCLRYQREELFVPKLFSQLQDNLGYTFRNGCLLREAVTHPSFASVEETSSYQRLEFLGDAILNLAVVHYLYKKFPAATSAQLALPRTKAVCSAALAYVAIKHLSVHKVMLVNSVELNIAIDQYVPQFEQISAETIVGSGWRYDPPKAISDVFEGIIGAVLIDSGYDYERTACVVEGVMEDVLSVLSPGVSLDPISTLSEWLAASGCRQHFAFKPEVKNHRTGERVFLHDFLISGPVFSTSTSIAKNVAAERAFSILQDIGHEHSLKNICTCGSKEIALANTSSDALETTVPAKNKNQEDARTVSISS
ncbi:type III restriction enzyme [Dendrothele bispora CBS 962.96]|uniref:Type III restriction enzyme n=1 Tax=Dendrothele bispora (strain CBS 962.96) TaxID=1314807 RepID=A0A4S8MPV6_DENBC|nr:type III restriction enzyme [Dendrothele bispora CBS 962.96]